jgi:hypothetical protein
MAIDFENFAAVFAEGLSADDRKRFAKLIEKQPDAKTIFGLALQSHVASLDPTMYIRRADKKLISRAAFNLQFTPLTRLFAKSRKPSDLADSTFDLRRATRAVYEPGKSEWVGTQFNMWRGVDIAPLAEMPKIFLEHVEYLIPDKRERGLFLDFLSWMVQHPDKKMMFALLIVGKGGTGKSWLSGLLQVLFGPHNALVLPKGEKAADKFNAEHANRQVIFVDELVPSENLNLARAIAPMITQSTLWVEPKGVDKFEAANRFNVIAVSNYGNAVKLARDDRRWLMIRATSTTRYGDDDNNATPATDAYFTRLFGVTPLPEGTVTPEVRRILWFLQQRDISGFKGQSQAPITDTKAEAAESSESSIEGQVREANAARVAPFGFALLTVQDVIGVLRLSIVDDGKRSMQSVRADVAAAMEAIGCVRLSGEQVYLPGGRRERLWVSAARLAPEFAGWSKGRLTDYYKAERELATDAPYDPAEFERAD